MPTIYLKTKCFHCNRRIKKDFQTYMKKKLICQRCFENLKWINGKERMLIKRKEKRKNEIN